MNMTTIKYAKLEIERKWLVCASQLPDLTKLPSKSIEDLYINNTRMRLRKEITDQSVTYKLCKKYGLNNEISEPIVNVYLSESEYRIFSKIDGNRICKMRYYYPFEGVRIAIDVAKNLPIMAEAEFTDEHKAVNFTAPDFCNKEITSDKAFEAVTLVKNLNQPPT